MIDAHSILIRPSPRQQALRVVQNRRQVQIAIPQNPINLAQFRKLCIILIIRDHIKQTLVVLSNFLVSSPLMRIELHRFLQR